MKYPFKITIRDHQDAWKRKDDVQIGHYFVYVKHKKNASDERLQRLLVKSFNKINVLPVISVPIELDDMTIMPEVRNIAPVACLVCDRELYRAMRDTVHLFIAFPKPPKDLRLIIECNGELCTERDVELTNGVGIKTLSMLPPGCYSAQLSIAQRRICTPVSFIIAEDVLVPLSARFLKHKFKQDTSTFLFELAVESYQIPFNGKLIGTVIEEGLEIADFTLKPVSPGRYTGRISISGEGPFFLHLMANNDAERVAELTIPGAQNTEQKISIISELGQEKLFSVMREPNALPLRGGHLTEGDFFDAPLTVDEIITNEGLIQVNKDIQSLVLVNLDLISSRYIVQEVGDISAGEIITATTDSPLCTVFVGGFVNDQAFEGYTTFIKPNPFKLSVSAPKTIKTGTDLVVRITTENVTDKTIPVLLCVRDERIATQKQPNISLGNAIQDAIDTATEGMNDRAFTTIEKVLENCADLSILEPSTEELELNSDFEVHAQLDLAQWFLDMNDSESAQKILTETLAKGNYIQKHRAQKMLQDMSKKDSTRSIHEIAVKSCLPLLDIESIQLDPEVIKLIDIQFLTKYQILPLFKRGNCLFIAISEPSNQSVLDDIKLQTTMQIEIILSEADKLGAIIEEHVIEFYFNMNNSGEDIEKINISEEKEEDLYLEEFIAEELSIEEELSPEEELSLEGELSLEEDLSPEEELSIFLDVNETDLIPENPFIQEATREELQQFEFPKVLFYEMVDVNNTKDVVIPLGDSLGTFTVETFAINEGNWTEASTTIVVEQSVQVALELPAAIHPNDQVLGRLHAFSRSRKAHITLKHNGEIVVLANGTPLNDFHTKTPVELKFNVNFGTYKATLEDRASGETDSIEMNIGHLGKFESKHKALNFLVKNESINLETSESLHILPNLDIPFERLITATANYPHFCCEQTAAKILAAIFMYLSSENDEQRSKAEQIIEAGIAREQQMLHPGMGFSVYPIHNKINKHLSKSTVRYLWKLKQLDALPNLSRHLRQAVRDGVLLAEQGAQAHHLQHMPLCIHSIEDSYIFAMQDENSQAVRKILENTIDGNEARLKKCQHAVADRATLAYAAASFLAIGELERGIKLANQVMRQFNEQGRLYSTLDSVAAIILMIQLKKSNIKMGEARLRVNGQEMSAEEAAKLTEHVKSIEVLEGIAAVEVIRNHEEDWSKYGSPFPVNIDFRNATDTQVQNFGTGERIDLLVSLPEGYQTGDIIHIALPLCMSWIQGSGQVKLFTLDFEGQDELRIPLVVTSKLEGKQHLAVCVRNMFEEERASHPEMLIVEEHKI